MASRRAHALNTEPQAIPAPAAALAPSPVRLASDEAATPSPALALQAEIEASWREEDGLTPIPGEWSARKRVTFLVGSSAFLWAAIGAAVYLLA